MITIEEADLKSYREYLNNEEKSKATIEKYVHDVENFTSWLDTRSLTKEEVLRYKGKLIEHYAPVSVNAALSSLNSFLSFLGLPELKVKSIRIQKQIFAPGERELTKAEYNRLLQAARQNKNDRLYLLMQAICSTGIRVSELRYLTVEAIGRGIAEINGKGKQRRVYIPRQLCLVLKQYARAHKIKSGAVFVTKSGTPMDRSNIWTEMKNLCKEANVPEEKVFPHNLRHLFARTYYGLQKDVVRLADILGHSSINTTRIYTMESGEVHRQQLQKLGLLQLKDEEISTT